MRIGTWNMEGKGGAAHNAFVEAQDCDVLLLSEVKLGWLPVGYCIGIGQPMTPRRFWAAVACRAPLNDVRFPHPASVAVRVGRATFVSSVLPWRSCGGRDPWRGESHAARTEHTVERLGSALGEEEDVVWGGDWNHAMSGREYAGSRGGRRAVLSLVDQLGLVVATADQLQRLSGLLSIDHIAVKAGVQTAQRVDASGLSDHDFYTVETDAYDGSRG